MCGSGGGAMSPSLTNFINTVLCSTSKLQLDWSCTEAGNIATNLGDGYLLSPDNEYELESFGPYNAEDRMGILLIHSDYMSITLHEKIRKKQFVSINGKEYYRSGDIIELNVHPNGVKIDMIGKITFPFQTKSGKWVRTGLVEKTIEGDQSIIQNAAIFGSRFSSSDDVVLVVFLANDHSEMIPDDVLKLVKETLHNVCKDSPWEIPTRVHITNEPWEWRPRKKVRNILMKKFSSPVNQLNPGTIPFGGNITFSSSRHIYETLEYSAKEFTYQLWSDQISIIRIFFFALIIYQAAGAPVPSCTIDSPSNFISCIFTPSLNSGDYFAGPLSDYFILDVLTGCDFFREDSTADGMRFRFTSCFLRDHSGVLREPEARGRFYHPDFPLDFRLHRIWEDIPWHLWDFREKYGFDRISMEKMRYQLNQILKIERRLLNIIPKVVPSLGYLHDVGVRFSRRLTFLKMLFQEQPELILEKNTWKRFQTATAMIMPAVRSPPRRIQIPTALMYDSSALSSFDEYYVPEGELDAEAIGRRFQVLMLLAFMTWLLCMVFAFRIFFPSTSTNKSRIQEKAKRDVELDENETFI